MEIGRGGNSRPKAQVPQTVKVSELSIELVFRTFHRQQIDRTGNTEGKVYREFTGDMSHSQLCHRFKIVPISQGTMWMTERKDTASPGDCRVAVEMHWTL